VPHAVARPLPRLVNVPSAGAARKRLKTDDSQLVTDSTSRSRIMLVFQSIGGFGAALEGVRAPVRDSRGRCLFLVGSLLALMAPT
jgi:hypothetical protein